MRVLLLAALSLRVAAAAEPPASLAEETARALLPTSAEASAAEQAAPPSPAAVPVDAAQAAAADLRARLDFEAGMDTAAAASVEAAIRHMMLSPTARVLAAEFESYGRRVLVRVAALDENVEGDTEFGAEHAVAFGRRAAAGGNPAFLAGILAHELLGHELNRLRAEAAGEAEAMGRWRGDEGTAGAVGWLVSTEADGSAPPDGRLWVLLADPEAYYAALIAENDYYALLLSPAEARRPEPALAARVRRLDEMIATLDRRLGPEDWAAIIGRMQTLLDVAPWRLADLRADLGPEGDAAERRRRDRADAIRSSLRKELDDARAPDRAASAEALADALNSPFFVDAQRRMDGFVARLREASRPPEGITIGPVDDSVLLGWNGLMRVYDADRRAHPARWSDLPAPP